MPPHQLEYALIVHDDALLESVPTALGKEPLAAYPLSPASCWEGDASDCGASVRSRRTEFSAVLIEWDLRRAAAFSAVCARLRDCSGPVIALLRNGDEAPTAVAVGADTFVSLPATRGLLRAQIIAHRRICADSIDRSPTASQPHRIAAGILQLDLNEGIASTPSVRASLAPRQAEVLAVLMRNAGRVVSRERLLRDAWEWDFDPGTNVVEVYIHYLRRVFRRLGLGPAIQTVRGRGYRLKLDTLGSERPQRRKAA